MAVICSAAQALECAMSLDITRQQAEAAVRTLLLYIGENPDRNGLIDTPKRVVKAFEEMTSGLHAEPSLVLGTVFDESSTSPVIVRDIKFTSLCEHHLLPFSGSALVAYQPNGKVIGLSKIPRLVQLLAKRPQVQERLTNQIAETLLNNLMPLGVGVIIKARHSCMACRGVRQLDAEMITSALVGDWSANVELLNYLSRHV